MGVFLLVLENAFLWTQLFSHLSLTLKFITAKEKSLPSIVAQFVDIKVVDGFSSSS